MILYRILEHDLHRARKSIEAIPVMISVPALPSFLPAIVSNTRGNFIVARKMKDNYINVGIFEYDSEKLDNLLPMMFGSAFDLSKSESFNNIFDMKSIDQAFEYINDNSVSGQPHVCLVPKEWNELKLKKIFGSKLNKGKYRKYCRIIPTDLSYILFCSRPDMVGMYTQILGGGCGVILHNVKFGLAFVIDVQN